MLSATRHLLSRSSTPTKKEQTPRTPCRKGLPHSKSVESLLALRDDRRRGNLSTLAAACRRMRMARKVGKGRFEVGVQKAGAV